jgi:uncharacterized membrane protein
MSPAAILAKEAKRKPGSNLNNTLFAKPEFATFLQYLAIAELVADKLPFLPNRTSSFSLAGRLFTGGIVGATIGHANHESTGKFAAAGALSALISAFISFNSRRFLTKTLRLPDFLVALSEDAAVGALGLWLLSERSEEDLIAAPVEN